MDLRPGDVIYGKDKSIKYEIIRSLGNGSFGLTKGVKSTNDV